MAPAPRVVVHRDADGAVDGAARDIAARIRNAAEVRGVAHVAFSGGSSAPALFGHLAAAALPWPLIHLYQVDERVAPDGDPDRNASELCEVLVAHIDVPSANVHLMPVTASDLDDGAARYGAALPRLDVVHLGMGDDGHTASWPPGDPVLAIRHQPTAVIGPFNGRMRMTLTPPVVAQAHDVVFLVTGESKRGQLRRMLAGDPDVPASHVPPDRTVVHCDRAAYEA